MSARHPPPRVLLSAADLRDAVDRVATAIAADHPDGVVLVGVLKGAVVFLADLVRALAGCGVAVQVDFLAITRYAPDSGRVRIVADLALDIARRDVVLVEDLVDTGLTLAYLVEHVSARSPRSVSVCTLLDRPARRIVPVEVRYVGVTIPDTWVLGYGLHFQERYRNLPFVVEADRDVVAADPDAYLDLYQRALG